MNLLELIVKLAAVISAGVAVLQYLESQRETKKADPQPPSKKVKQSQTALLASVMIAGLLMGVMRPAGMLQQLELMAFDRMMRSQPAEKPDSRLLIVAVTNKDIQYQDRKGMDKGAASLSDQALAEVLQKLNLYQPRVIGLNIYRPFSVNPKFPHLAKQIQQNDRLIVTCSVGRMPPPPEISAEQSKRLGFSNTPKDPDRVIRRQLLGMSPSTKCRTDQSFSLLVALRYLKEEKISPIEFTSERNLQIGKVIFHKLVSDAGGYQLPRQQELGYQIFLNYRSGETIARQITLEQLLEGSMDSKLPGLVNDRIILIGITAQSYGDLHLTPYSIEMPGVLIQAHMVSQIISAVLDRRPLLWWWPQELEMLWVWFWCLAVGILIEHWQLPLSRMLVVGGGLGVLSGLCVFVFRQGGWLPLVPSALGLMLTGLCVVVLTISRNHY